MSEDRRENQDREFSRPLAELISAYLDDRESLSGRELEQVELLLEQDEDAQRLQAEMRIIADGLRNFDSLPAPRSYHLDAEMVGAPEPVVLQETTAWSSARWARHTQTVRWATAAAAVLFVFVLGVDLVLNGVFSDSAGDDGSFESNQAEMTSRQDADGGAEADILADEGAGEGADADAGPLEDAPSSPIPESSEDSDDEGDFDSDMSDEAMPEEESEGTVEEAEEEESEDGASGGTDAAEATEAGPPAAEIAPDALERPQEGTAPGEASTNDETLAFDQDAAESDDEGSDRRLWRIAEFGLVVLLGLLITALVVLPRLGGNGAAGVRNGR